MATRLMATRLMATLGPCSGESHSPWAVELRPSMPPAPQPLWLLHVPAVRIQLRARPLQPLLCAHMGRLSVWGLEKDTQMVITSKHETVAEKKPRIKHKYSKYTWSTVLRHKHNHHLFLPSTEREALPLPLPTMQLSYMGIFVYSGLMGTTSHHQVMQHSYFSFLLSSNLAAKTTIALSRHRLFNSPVVHWPHFKYVWNKASDQELYFIAKRKNIK